MEHENLLKPTALLDWQHPEINKLVSSRKWASLDTFKAIGSVYDFVRNEILFGYNARDTIPASQVLGDGFGQCNTKAILLMALMRAISVPCRLRGFTIHKELQRGVVPELVYPITPDNILHSWVEIYFDNRWINLEGFILDEAFLSRLQDAFASRNTEFCGFGAGTADLANPLVEWSGQDTYIQNTAINNDFGLFDSPDDFYARHEQDLPWWKQMLFSHIVRHWMNRRVRKIRAGHPPGKIPLSTCPSRLPASRFVSGQGSSV